MTKFQLLAMCGTNIKYVVPITGEILSPDKVIVSKYAGTEVKYENEEYIIVKQDEILAIVE